MRGWFGCTHPSKEAATKNLTKPCCHLTAKGSYFHRFQFNAISRELVSKLQFHINLDLIRNLPERIISYRTGIYIFWIFKEMLIVDQGLVNGIHWQVDMIINRKVESMQIRSVFNRKDSAGILPKESRRDDQLLSMKFWKCLTCPRNVTIC